MIRVYVECDADEKLARLMLRIRRRRDIEHCGNKSGVVKKLEKSVGALAFLDEDPHAPQLDYIARLEVTRDYGHSKILEDEKGNIIIILSPRIEEWIEDCILREIPGGSRVRLRSRHPWIGTSDFEEYFHSPRLKSLEDIIHSVLEDPEDNRIKTIQRLLLTKKKK
jgi:hypothetical protein